MNKQDEFDKFFEEHQESFFDQEPSFGHFNRFAKKLEAVHENANKKGRKQYGYRWISAAMLALIALGFTLFSMQKENNSSKSQNLVESFGRTSSSSINVSFSPDNDEVKSSLDDVTYLEMEYVKLKHEYNSSNQCDEVLAAMKHNLETRLAVLDCIKKKEVQEEMKFVHKEYLLNHNSDCYGYPSYRKDQTVQNSSLYIAE